MQRVCIFCGSRNGTRSVYVEAARRTGEALARHGVGLVYGGGHVGLMGMVADAVLAGGGEVIGVIPEFLFTKELGHIGVTDLRIVGSMHERKALMAELADGFIALPGGYGTLEEFCEVLTWAQLGLHAKPCGLLNIDHFYDPLLALFDNLTATGFVPPSHRSLVLASEDPDELLDAFAHYQPPATIAKWIERDET